MADYDVDLFVIGAGSGGVRAARIAAGYGAKVMLAEEYRVGGTCVIRGCIPKKLMVYASRFADAFADAEGFGWTSGSTSFDWAKLVAAKDKEITRLSAIYRANLDKAGVALVEGRALVEDAHKVRLLADGRIISAKVILVATGAAPFLGPDVPGRELAITSNEIFDLKPLPKHILIVGGGYIAVEFAALLRRLGSEVTIALRGENILRGFDDDLRAALRDALSEAGIAFKFGNMPTRLEKQGEAISVTLAKGETLVVDQVMLATGRHPNTRGLGLEKLGVRLDAVGAVCVDPYSQSSVPSIYAVGDVTNRLALTPVAIREGHAFADTVFGGKARAVDHSNVPTAVFTTPELGTVGLTEADARLKHAIVDVFQTQFRPLKATLSGRAEKVFMKIVVDGETGRVLGVHILGDDAG
ncbi:MAG: glutathione-disulfide reductase, partial [Xanthobacteraceae bacterium]|nr:glutathione-disulfide reductase [Xanthobacteraceae bacterium]